MLGVFDVFEHCFSDGEHTLCEGFLKGLESLSHRTVDILVDCSFAEFN